MSFNNSYHSFSVVGLINNPLNNSAFECNQILMPTIPPMEIMEKEEGYKNEL